MKKKYLILFCLFIFLFGTNNVFAMTLKPNGINKCQRGEEITIYVSLDRTQDEKEVSAIDGTFNFDSNIFSVITSSGLINNWTELSNIKDNTIFSYANLEFNNLLTTSNENIVKVVLKVKDDAKFGNTNIEISNTHATDEKGNEIIIEGKNHTIKIISNINNLSGLETNKGSIKFHKDTIKYNLVVENDIDNIKISASLEESSSSFLENFGSREVDLAVGENIIEIKVKAENGEIQTYTLNIIRKEKELSDETDKPDDNTKPDDGEDKPSIDDNKPNDDENKPSDSDNLEEDKSNNDEKDNNDKEHQNGSNSGTTNTTKPENENKKSSNNYLSTLIPSEGVITFDKAITEYNITIPYEVNEISFELKPENPRALIKIEGNEDLKVGKNEITITVTAEDGNIRRYKINVNKKEKDVVLSNNSNLKRISIKGYNIDFNSNKYNYNIKIKDEEYLNITYVKDDDKSNVTITGNENLKDGSIIKISVVAEDGSTSTYIINIEKSTTKRNMLLPIIILLLLLLLLVIYFIIKKIKISKKEN